MITVSDSRVAPAGSVVRFAATIGSLTGIAGLSITASGRYLYRTARALSGDVPAVSVFTVVRLFTPAIAAIPQATDTKYTPVVGAVNGFLTSWMIGSWGRNLSGALQSAPAPAQPIMQVIT